MKTPDFVHRVFHSWVQVGEVQERKNAMYTGDPNRINYRCTGCRSTKSMLTTVPPRLNRYKAVSPTCAEKAGFKNRKHYKPTDIITRQQTNNLINKIPGEKIRVLSKILYLFAPRIQEAIWLKKKDLTYNNKDIILNRFILKVPLEADGQHPQRLTHIPIKDSFNEEIISYFDSIHRPNDYVFPKEMFVFGNPQPINYKKHLSRNRAITMVKDATNRSPHYYRHLRISHWAPMCRTIWDLKKKTHHQSISSLEKYVHLISGSDDIEVG